MDHKVGQTCTKPDKLINLFGKKLINVCNMTNMVIINGLKESSRNLHSDFTFFRGNLKSQNDWCITNSPKSVRSFSIIPKLNLSDHSPLSVNISSRKLISLTDIYDVSSGTFSYDMYDRSKLLKPKLLLSNISTENLIMKLEKVADGILTMLDSHVEIENVCAALSDEIYDACTKKRTRRQFTIPVDKENLTSRNFRAIAEANLFMYSTSIQRNDDPLTSFEFYENWVANSEFAILREKEEYNGKN